MLKYISFIASKLTFIKVLDILVVSNIITISIYYHYYLEE